MAALPPAHRARREVCRPAAELIVTRGLGHNRLLADPAVVAAIVVAAIVDFVSDQEMTGSASIS
ncbi:MAG: hypothetical protein LCH93_20175 [Proteobacteria bacterium]|nr:hypothetical protein [Pseudomonadota bacterium]